MTGLLILGSQESQTPLQGLWAVTLDPRTGPKEAASASSRFQAAKAVVLFSIVDTLADFKLVVPGIPGVIHVGSVLVVHSRPVQHHHHVLQFPQPGPKCFYLSTSSILSSITLSIVIPGHPPPRQHPVHLHLPLLQISQLAHHLHLDVDWLSVHLPLVPGLSGH